MESAQIEKLEESVKRFDAMLYRSTMELFETNSI